MKCNSSNTSTQNYEISKKSVVKNLPFTLLSLNNHAWGWRKGVLTFDHTPSFLDIVNQVFMMLLLIIISYLCLCL